MNEKARGDNIISSADNNSSDAPRDRDAELMLAFQNGKAEAFDELVKRNLNSVHSLVYRFMRNANHVDDITQEAFLRIYNNADKYRPTAKFSTWLYRIVANLCFNVMRNKKYSRTVSLDSSKEATNTEIADKSVRTPDQKLDDSELGQAIADAISQLPENQRMAIILRQYKNKNYEEIADIMQTSSTAVKSLLSRARTTLREKLSRYLMYS